MPHRVALIHAVNMAIAPVRVAFREIWPTADCIGLHDDSLSPDRERDQRLTDIMCCRIQALADYAMLAGAEGILFTCSAFGEAIDRVAKTAPVPVLKPNQAMFEAALALGDRIGMVATFAPSVASMQQEFRDIAGRAGRSEARIDVVCVPEAMAALKAGDDQAHNRRVAEAAAGLGSHDAVVDQNDLDPVGSGNHQRAEKGTCRHRAGLVDELRKGELRGASIPTYRYNLPSAVCASAMSMWKKPIG